MDGNVDDTPINLFRKQFLSPLSDLLDSRPGATAILVPSIKDALSGHAVFPQNELSASLVEDTVRSLNSITAHTSLFSSSEYIYYRIHAISPSTA